MKEKRVKNQRNRRFLLAWLVVILTGLSCNLPTSTQPVQTAGQPPAIDTLAAAPSSTASALPTPSATPSLASSATLTPTPSWTPTRTSTVTRTQTPTETPTSTTTPTYAILRGKVLERANCRYGPGAPYLYKYGILAETNMQVIGRNERGAWVLVQAIGGDNPCWIKSSLMEIKGDVMSVAPTYTPLPQSPYYGPPTGVAAVRNGNEVIVSWNAVILRAGDDSEQFPYLIEAWVCTNGELIFTPIGSYASIVNIQDEPGCAEPSHGRLYAVEKHGYTQWVEIPWP